MSNDRSFYFHPHVRHAEKPVQAFFTFLCAASFLLPLPLMHWRLSWGNPALRLAVYLSATFALCGILAVRLTRQWKKYHYVVTGEHLLEYGPWAVRAVRFSEVRKLSHFRMFYWAGLATLSSATARIQLPYIIEDLAKLGECVAEGLRAHGKADLAASETMADFIRSARVSDLITERIAQDLPALSRIVILMTFLSCFVVLKIWCLDAFFSVLWTTAGFVFPLIGYLVANAFLSSAIAKKLTMAPAEPMHFDYRGLYLWTALATGFVYLICGVILHWVALGVVGI
jgi:hypothetical protein